MLDFIKEAPWQIGVWALALWCSGLTAVLVLIARLLYRRFSKFPSVTMTKLFAEWDEHDRKSQEHISQIEANTKELEWMVPSMRTHGELGLRMTNLEVKVEEQGRDNKEEHRRLFDALHEIDVGLAGVKGYAEGKKNGKVADA